MTISNGILERMKQVKQWFVFVIVMASATVASAKVPNDANLPNIILLFADDLGWVDVSTGQTNGGRGSTIYETPNIDRIAAQGMSFTHAYTQQNCAPSRASLISGMYATGAGNGVYNVTSLSRQDRKTEGFPNLSIVPHEQRRFILDNGVSIFDMARKAGYQTCFIGKSHGTPHPLGRGYGLNIPGDVHHIIKGKVNGKTVQSYYLAVKDDKRGWTFKSPFVNKYASPYDHKYLDETLAPFKHQSDLSQLPGSAKHLTDAIGDFCVNYIKGKADGAKPFFLYVPFHAVHYKVVGRKDLVAKYKSRGLAAKDAEYAAMVELLDQNIGKIANAVKDPNGDGDASDDLSANTLFIVYSDNGGTRGNGPLTGGKGVFTEGGIRVPLICKWDGVIAPNSVSSQAVHCIDMYPTLAEFAGVEISDVGDVSLDGVSFASILTGEAKRLDRDNLFWHFPGYMGSRLRPSTMIHKRVGDEYFKLFYSYETQGFHLFNISQDLSEEHNLLEKPSAKEFALAQTMNRDMTRWLKANRAPTGTWTTCGGTVPYPSENGVDKYKE